MTALNTMLKLTLVSWLVFVMVQIPVAYAVLTWLFWSWVIRKLGG